MSENLLKRLLSSLRYRAEWSKLGVPLFKTRRSSLDRLRIAGKWIPLHFPDVEQQIHEHELHLIFYDDCYWLKAKRQTPHTVVDIGGNIGIFSLIARSYFKSAIMFCYEPNMELAPYLNSHLEPLGVQIFQEAVGANSGFVSLEAGSNSLHTQIRRCTDTQIPLVSFAEVVKRCGGYIDLLKLDGEGIEWEIIERSEAISSVKEIVMEYHLWAKPGSTFQCLTQLLDYRGFSIVDHRPGSSSSWGLVRAIRATSVPSG